MRKTGTKIGFTIILTLLVLQHTLGQQRQNALADTLYSLSNSENKSLDKSEVNLPRYQVDSCLFSLMAELVNKDKECNNKIGYYFSTTLIYGKPLIKISPVDLDRVHPAKFFGYFIYQHRIFLCFGNKSEYLSAIKTSEVLKLWRYTSNEIRYADFYLGGDTDGTMQQVVCAGKTQHILLKSCNTKQKASRGWKPFH